jgi:acetyl-CoA C-acetyltransferase
MKEANMGEIVIAGIGQTVVGEQWDISLRSLAARAIQAARRDAGERIQPQALYVGNLLGPVLSDQANLATLLADNVGLAGMEAISVEAADASGAAAFRLGYLAVASGYIDTALVLGVEKYTDAVGPAAEEAVSQTLNADFEAMHGLTPTAQAALLMQRYLHVYGIPRMSLAEFPILAHANAAGNPCAMFRGAVTYAMYEDAEPICDPINLFDKAPYADGAAAVIITRAEKIPAGFSNPLVRVMGSSVVTDTLALHDREDPLAFKAAGLSLERACRKAGILPTDADLFELSDHFSIYAALTLEAAGLARPGEGWKLVRDGQLTLKGSLPINTMGGAKGRGHPIGASGVYQVVEAVLQLRGRAGVNQVPDAKCAIVQCLGGAASTAITHVLKSL